MKKLLLFSFVLIGLWVCSTSIVNAQGVGINPNGTPPHNSAGLDINFTDKGLLPPRMTSAQRDAIVLPAAGLTIFNTTTNCTNVYNSSAWYELCGTCIPGIPSTPGSISGSATQCASATAQVYGISAVAGAITYNWTVPAGWTITNGAGSISITVTTGAAGQNGDITVAAANGCGTSAASTLAVTVSSLAAPAALTHTSTETQIVWNWSTVAQASGYKWNTTNGYATATDLGNATTVTQTGLSCGTAYNIYIWAYNACGSSSVLNLSQSTSSCFNCGVSNLVDNRDGTSYPTVSIGSQCWMKKNLAYLPSVVGSGTKSTSVAYNYVWGYEGTSVSAAKSTGNYQSYGVLYNWTSAINACPSGWHLPGNAEWMQLEMALGMSSSEANRRDDWRGTNQGTQMKATSSDSPPFNGTNTSGFSAVPAGWFDTSGFGNLGSAADFWATTPADWRRLAGGITGVGRFSLPQDYGISVRCLKD